VLLYALCLLGVLAVAIVIEMVTLRAFLRTAEATMTIAIFRAPFQALVVLLGIAFVDPTARLPGIVRRRQRGRS
jgi:hypothetical protein